MYHDLKPWLEAVSLESNPIVVLLDGLEDPRNFGAILRTCEAVGVDAVVIPKKRSVQVTDTVRKTSTGAADLVNVIQVSNLNNTIHSLKQKGFWIVGLEADGPSDYFDLDLVMPVVLVVGSEGSGLSRLVKENCDFVASIPMLGQISSLNASVAAALLLYEALRQRRQPR